MVELPTDQELQRAMGSISEIINATGLIRDQVIKPRAMTRECQAAVGMAVERIAELVPFVCGFFSHAQAAIETSIQRESLPTESAPPTQESTPPTDPTQESTARVLELMAEYAEEMKAIRRAILTPEKIRELVQETVLAGLAPLQEEVRTIKAKVLEPSPPPPTPPKLSLDGEAKMEFGRLLRSELQTFASESSVLVAPAQPQPSKVRAAPRDSSEKPQPPPEKKPQILVKTKKVPPPDTTSVIKKWRASIPFAETGAPSKVIPLAYGQFKVEMEKEEALEKIMRASNEIADMEAQPVRRRPPLLILKGIPKDASSPEELIGTLERQNGLSGLRLCFLRSNRKPELYNAVVEATPLQAREAIARGRLEVGYQRVHTEQYIPFVQCQNCNTFGHTRKKCTKPQRCYYCGERGHDGSECAGNPVNSAGEGAEVKPICHNCYNHNLDLVEEKREGLKVPERHTATDRENCTLIKRMIRRLLDETDL